MKSNSSLVHCHALVVCAVSLAVTLGCARDETSQSADSATVADSTSFNAAPLSEDLTKVDTSFAPELGVNLAAMTRLESGLYIHDLKKGTGPVAKSGDTIRTHYTGWLTNGEKFDSSLDRTESLEFPLGTGFVIHGWDQGIPGMRVGGRRRIVVPPALGYGAAGQPGTIPSRATLVFDVELLSVR